MNPKDLKVTITAVPVDVPPMTLEEAQRLAAQDFGERTQALYHGFDGGYGSYGQEPELRAFRLGMATVVRVDERMRLALVWALEEVVMLRAAHEEQFDDSGYCYCCQQHDHQEGCPACKLLKKP